MSSNANSSINALSVEALGYKSALVPFTPFLGPCVRRANPVTIGLVCWYWRAATLAYPHLWATLHLENSKRPDVDLQAGTHPLPLSFNEPPQPSDSHACRVLPKSFFRRRTYWKSNDLFISPATLEAMSSNCPLAPQQLQAISSKVHGSPDPTHLAARGTTKTLDDLWQWFHLLPSLRSVDWGTVYSRPPTHCPYSRITRIALQSPPFTLPALLQMLPNCMHIEVVDVMALGSGIYATNTGPLTIPSLLTLDITYLNIGLFFNYITLPALQSLSIKSLAPIHGVDRGIATFAAFLQRSNCSSLTSFNLVVRG